MPIETFKQKYPKPKQCGIPDQEWFSPLGYCWGYAQRIDSGEKWNNKMREDCEFKGE